MPGPDPDFCASEGMVCAPKRVGRREMKLKRALRNISKSVVLRSLHGYARS